MCGPSMNGDRGRTQIILGLEGLDYKEAWGQGEGRGESNVGPVVDCICVRYFAYTCDLCIVG